MSKYIEALDRIQLDNYCSFDDEDRLIDIKKLKDLVFKYEMLREYLIEQKQSHTMSRFLRVSDLESFRYAIDLILTYLDENKELDYYD